MHAQQQDALSDILRLVRLKGCVYFQSDFSSPWGMEMPAGPFAQFHVVVRGQCWLLLGEARHLLAAGDVVVLPHGHTHALLDDPATPTIPGPDVLAAIQAGSPPFAVSEPTARLLCGHFEFDHELNHPLFIELPRLLWIKGMASAQPGWLEATTPMLIGETGAGRPGADTIVERLAEVLLIQVLRAYLSQLPSADGAEQGFLAALADRRINSALKLIHLYAGQPMTLQDIARTIGMSRSALAARFKELVGDTPMNYLTSWRMLKAKDILKSGGLPLAEVAERVGYRSEAAFSRAFKRECELSPSDYRRVMARS